MLCCKRRRGGMTDRERLSSLALGRMQEKGLLTTFSQEALAEVREIERVAKELEGDGAVAGDPLYEDMRAALFVSIDNDDTMDIDQVQAVELLPNGNVRVLVGIADVAHYVRKGSALDAHALHNCATCYTPAVVNMMLPRELAHGVTSLNEHVTRRAMVVAFELQGVDFSKSREEVGKQCDKLEIVNESVRMAFVYNHAKLAYSSVGSWLAGSTAPPKNIAQNQPILDSLMLQDKVGEVLAQHRHMHGALHFNRLEFWIRFEGNTVAALEEATSNRATLLVENFMIAANGVVSRFLSTHNRPTIQRSVKDPERWQRIVDLAKSHGFALPAHPDPVQLRKFLVEQHEKQPVGFAELSLKVIQMMGRGVYEVSKGGNEHGHGHGHFALAVRDYTHSTAPNRRYPDLITQRFVIATLKGEPDPYSDDELRDIAGRCTHWQGVTKKLQRSASKSCAAVLMEKRVGEEFVGVITGASKKGVWIRVDNPPVEGRVLQDCDALGCEIADRVRVRLVHVQIDHAHIDFEYLGPAS